MTLKRDVDYGAVGGAFAFSIRHTNESAARIATPLPIFVSLWSTSARHD